MTILEALQAALGDYEAGGNVLSKALIDQGLTDTDAYTTDNKASVDKAAIAVLNGILYSSVSEGGYSVTYNADAIKAKIRWLGGGPEVNGVSVW